MSCRSTSTRSRPCATRAAARCRRCSTPAACVVDAGRRRHHRASARRRAAHHAATMCEIADVLAPLRAVEFNIEGDPRPDLLALVRRSQARPVHAGAGGARRDHQSGRVAGRRRRATSSSNGAVRRSAGGAACASACSSIRNPRRFSWAAGMGARSRRAVHRSRFRQRLRRGARARPPSAASRRRRTGSTAAGSARRQRRPRSRPELTCHASLLARVAACLDRAVVDRPRRSASGARYVGPRKCRDVPRIARAAERGARESCLRQLARACVVAACVGAALRPRDDRRAFAPRTWHRSVGDV